jgi:hypothetical protein
VIVRILGEGQLEIAEEHYDELQAKDADLEAAIEAGDEEGFRLALLALVELVHEVGEPYDGDEYVESDFILPAVDATMDEVATLLSDTGLIPD